MASESDTSALVAFIEARLADEAERLEGLRYILPESVLWVEDDDETGARQCVGIEVNGAKTYRRWWPDSGATDWGWRMHESAVELYSTEAVMRAQRDVEARRRILKAYTDAEQEGQGFVSLAGFDSCSDSCAAGLLGAVLRVLARAWDTHADFREEWRA